VIARLHDDILHIVVSSRARIRRLKDLDGKRVAIDTANSATEATVRQLLRAAGVTFASLKVRQVAADKAEEELQDGGVDAFFVLGVAPVRSVDQLTRRGFARLLAVDTRTMQKLVRLSPMYRKTTLPAGAYRGSKAVAQLGVASLWVVNRSLPDETVFQILKALWNPTNQDDLRSRSGFGSGVELHLAPENVPLPLHDGAKRFYASAQR
jgi:TRAP transporter TAXI family solute receptor